MKEFVFWFSVIDLFVTPILIVLILYGKFSITQVSILLILFLIISWLDNLKKLIQTIED